MARASGSFSQITKLDLVPNSIAFTDELAIAITAWLQNNVPSWVDCLATSCCKYLGLLIGPTSNTYQWVAPLLKYTKRAALIGKADAGPRSRVSSTTALLSLF